MANYFDKDGNYINVENLSLADIYHRAFALGVESVDLWGMRQEATENALKKAEMLYKRPTVCGNDPKWCENCVSKGNCASTRPQGKWITKGYEPFGKCNICDGICEINNFCGHCGAEMRKEGNG